MPKGLRARNFRMRSPANGGLSGHFYISAASWPRPRLQSRAAYLQTPTTTTPPPKFFSMTGEQNSKPRNAAVGTLGHRTPGIIACGQ